ncbi:MULTISPECIES: hypothetical protein [unclassified Microbacterium]|uniref:hypothetical protein n=1 Tax=unclassified Microbacterium TaxID=2609290 RepID=UPI00262843BF|nr:hypothetical protein [Microbacterium sp.]
MNKRAWTWGAIGAAIVIGAVVGSELIVRANIDTRIDTATSGFTVEGLSVSSGPTPAIWQALTGRVDLQVMVDSSAVAAMAACRFDTPVDVRIEPTGLSVTVEMPYRGRTIPTTIGFLPSSTPDGWKLVPSSVTVAGFEVPPAMLSRAGDAVPAALIDGIELPSDPDAIAVTTVSLAQDELTLSVTAPASASGASGLAGPLAGCAD